MRALVMNTIRFRYPILLVTSCLLLAVWAMADRKMPEWSVETASPEEALMAAFDAAGTANLRRFDTLDAILDKYPEFLNSVQEETDYTLVYCAAEANNDEIIRYLSKLGANVDAKSWRGFSPLHVAASDNRAAAVEALIECGADINQLTTSKIPSDIFSALDIAARDGAEGAVKVLLKKGAKLDAHPPESSNPAIFFAMRLGWELQLKLVVQRQKSYKWKPKLFGDPGPLPATGNAAVIELLVNAGADLKGRNFEGDQPLHVAIRSHQVETMKVLLEKYRDKIDIEGRAITKSNPHGLTPLMTAAYCSSLRDSAIRVKMIELLKKHGADPTVKQIANEEFSRTAYDMAVSYGSTPEVIAALKPAP